MGIAVSLPLIASIGVFLVTGLPVIILWRRCIQWKNTEIALIPIPWLFWELLEYPGVSWHPGKTLENLAVENAILGLLPLGYVLYRRFVFAGEPQRRHFYCGAVAGLGCAFLLHRYMPTLGMIYG